MEGSRICPALKSSLALLHCRSNVWETQFVSELPVHMKIMLKGWFRNAAYLAFILSVIEEFSFKSSSLVQYPELYPKVSSSVICIMGTHTVNIDKQSSMILIVGWTRIVLVIKCCAHRITNLGIHRANKFLLLGTHHFCRICIGPQYMYLFCGSIFHLIHSSRNHVYMYLRSLSNPYWQYILIQL